VAVVRAPAVRGHSGPLIVALGGSMQEATATAAQQWHQLWRKRGVLH